MRELLAAPAGPLVSGVVPCLPTNRRVVASVFALEDDARCEVAKEDYLGNRQASQRSYWISNLRLIGCLLAIWFLVSFVLGIFLAEPLASVRVGRLPAGFWWAQQGSMFVFVILIFVYAWRMDRLDRSHRDGGEADR